MQTECRETRSLLRRSLDSPFLRNCKASANRMQRDSLFAEAQPGLAAHFVEMRCKVSENFAHKIHLCAIKSNFLLFFILNSSHLSNYSYLCNQINRSRRSYKSHRSHRLNLSEINFCHFRGIISSPATSLK